MKANIKDLLKKVTHLGEENNKTKKKDMISILSSLDESKKEEFELIKGIEDIAKKQDHETGSGKGNNQNKF